MDFTITIAEETLDTLADRIANHVAERIASSRSRRKTEAKTSRRRPPFSKTPQSGYGERHILDILNELAEQRKASAEPESADQ